MKKILKPLIVSLCLVVGIIINCNAVHATGTINQHFDKHYISEAEKTQLSDIISESKLDDKIFGLYSGINHYSLTEPIKLYRLNDEDFVNLYNDNDKLTKYLTNSYKILQCIKSDSGKTLGAVIFNKPDEIILKRVNKSEDSEVKSHALKFYQDHWDKWYISTVGNYTSPENLEFITNFDRIQEKLEEAEINNVDDIFIIGANDVLPLMIYVQTPTEEYALPIAHDDASYFKTGNVYKLKDLVSSQIKLIKEFEKIPKNERPLGGTNIKLPPLNPVNKSENTLPQLFLIAIPVIALFLLIILLKYNFSRVKELFYKK